MSERANKLKLLIKRLLEETRSGRLRWSETADSDAYRVGFPDLLVRVEFYPVNFSYGLSIFDLKGKLLEMITEVSGTTPPLGVFMLFDEARASALDLDKRLDTLLSDIDSGRQVQVLGDDPIDQMRKKKAPL